MNSRLDSANLKDSLKLDHIFGYNQHPNNSICGPFGEHLYSSGKYIVSYSESKTQKICCIHSHIICAIASNTSKDKFASGDIVGCVLVWDPIKLEVMSRYAGPYSTKSLRFCNHNQNLCAIFSSESTDVIHVIDSLRGELLICLSVPFIVIGVVVFDVSIICLNSTYISAWNHSSMVIPFEHPSKSIQFTGIVEIRSSLFVCSSLGGFLHLGGTNSIIKTSKAHKGNITCLQAANEAVLTCDEDAILGIWNESLEPIAMFDGHYYFQNADIGIKDFVMSLCSSFSLSKIILGTRSGKVLELSLRDGALSQLNFESLGIGEKITVVKSNPLEDEIFIAAEDGTVSIWHLASMKNILSKHLHLTVSCADYSSSNECIAIGMRHCSERSETVVLLSRYDLSLLSKLRDSISTVLALKFSGNDKFLVAAYCTGDIHIYHCITATYFDLTLSLKVKSVVEQIYFSIDNEYALCCCDEHIVINVVNGVVRTGIIQSPNMFPTFQDAAKSNNCNELDFFLEAHCNTAVSLHHCIDTVVSVGNNDHCMLIWKF